MTELFEPTIELTAPQQAELERRLMMTDPRMDDVWIALDNLRKALHCVYGSSERWLDDQLDQYEDWKERPLEGDDD